MASAKKCDRCEQYYDDIREPEIWVTVDRYSRQVHNGFNKVDLCPNCREVLKNWLNEFKPDKKKLAK